METVDRGFEAGYNAGRLGVGFLANPFADGSVESRRYVDGYVKAIQDVRAEPAAKRAADSATAPTESQ